MKKKLHLYYSNIFKNTEIKLLKPSENLKSNYWLNTIIVSNKNIKKKLILFSKQRNFNVRPIWKPINLFKHFKKNPKMNLDDTLIFMKEFCLYHGVLAKKLNKLNILIKTFMNIIYIVFAPIPIHYANYLNIQNFKKNGFDVHMRCFKLFILKNRQKLTLAPAQFYKPSFEKVTFIKNFEQLTTI